MAKNKIKYIPVPLQYEVSELS